MSANKVLMVRPVGFGFNHQTGVDNTFQQQLNIAPEQVRKQVLAEFEQAVSKLGSFGVKVLVLEKSAEKVQTPDAVFPNNWLATDHQGNIHLFAMKTPNRQAEVRAPEVKSLLQLNGLKVGQTMEVGTEGQVLEGTGAMVFDHQAKISYGALSERCHLGLLEQYCGQIGYQPLSFNTRGSTGGAIYHTNVMMSVGEDFVLACVDAIVAGDKAKFIQAVKHSGKKLIEISLAQMEQHFCGNILELSNDQSERVLALSQQAWHGLDTAQQQFFSQRLKICVSDISTIETIGGGSMRCMLAELFNPES